MMTPGLKGVLADMRKAGLEITRENFIAWNWAGIPLEWDDEYEDQLPENLQDWSLFESKDGNRTYVGPPIVT